MTLRRALLAFAVIASALSVMATVTTAPAQNVCSRFCDCDLECLDFCGTRRCPCEFYTKMKTSCEKACRSCKRFKRSRKPD